MAFLGLVLRKEHNRVLEEVAALKASLPQYSEWLLATAKGERYTLPDPSIYGNQADLYRKLSWVLLAVDLTATAGALSDFSVKRVIAEKEPKDIPNHPFEILLRHPNEADSRYEFLYATIAFWKLTGNAYWWLNRENKYAPPDEMWFIHPSMIKPIPDERLFLRGYMYYPGDGREIFLEPHEIVHFKRFNPFSRFVGLSAIESIALVAQGDLGMQDWNTRLFKENNARLPGILTFEQMIQDPTWEKIKSETREAAKNRELMMLRGVGQGAVQWIQNTVSQKEMEFLEGRKFNKDEIMTALAPGSYSMLSENSTEANSKTGRAAFNELTVYPMHVMMAEKITNNILPSYGGRQLIGEFEDIRITDRALELQEQQEFAKVHVIREIREQFYGDDPLGDERDDLLPEQIKAGSGGIQKTQPPVNQDMGQPNQQVDQPPEQNDQQNNQQNDTRQAQKKAAILDELSKFERKAMKKVGKEVSFHSDILDAELTGMIHRKLAACNTEADVQQVFASAKKSLSPADDEAWAVVRAIELALRA